MLKSITLLCLLLLTACGQPSGPTTLILDYEDFGPPVVAQEVIGMDWWQWLDHGDSRPKHYPIKVVVFRGIPLDEVKSSYPVEPEREQDYRYLEYSHAIQYLDKLIAENAIEAVTAQLTKTRSRIVSGFETGAEQMAY
jgi:hypothetical protein